MRTVVTGAAGFVASHLVDRLLADGHDVVGIDAFTEAYTSAAKEGNVASALAERRFVLERADLLECDLDALLDGADAVFHLAGQPGVRTSWAAGFDAHLQRNVLATQRLLEAAVGRFKGPFVFASSSSVYGDQRAVPTSESAVPNPRSPYGVTKLAAEHLCEVYARNRGLRTVALRYFTVYGPRQRPDMAIHRLVEGALTGKPFSLFGDGSQVRDFTFVDDVVTATIAAATSSLTSPQAINVAGGAATIVSALIELVEAACGKPVPLVREEAKAGDVARTGGDISRAREALGWEPSVSLEEGVRRQVAWHVARRSG